MMTSFDEKAELKLIEIISFDKEFNIHPTEVEKGNFSYWTELSEMVGIDLSEETEINARMEEENGFCGVCDLQH